jgi:hypothetical protein
MNTNTVIKCLIIQASSLLPELQEMVKSYAFYDTSTYEFQHRQCFRPSLQRIHQAFSRKNGFDGICENDTTDEHWSFDTLGENIQIQAFSCHICGEYIASNALYYENNLRQQCKCPHNHVEDNVEDIDEDYEEDYDF